MWDWAGLQEDVDHVILEQGVDALQLKLWRNMMMGAWNAEPMGVKAIDETTAEKAIGKTG